MSFMHVNTKLSDKRILMVDIGVHMNFGGDIDPSKLKAQRLKELLTMFTQAIVMLSSMTRY